MRRASCFVAGALVLTAMPQLAASSTFTRIVGSGDPVPGAQGEVFLEVHSAQLAGGWIAARGYSANEAGLYLWHREVGYRLVTRTSDLPGLPPGGELSLSQGGYDVDADGRVVVAAGGYLPDDPESTYRAGVWFWESGEFELLVLEGQTVPGSDRPFIAGGRPTIEDGRVLFRATEGTPEDFAFAIYGWSRETGIVRLVGPGFISVSWPAAAGGRFTFAGWGGGIGGLWSAALDGSDVQLEHDFSTPYPGGPPGSTWQLISGGSDSVITAPPITFAARSSGAFERHGLYRLHGEGTYELLLDGAAADPTSGLAHLGIVPGVVGSGETVAFMLRDPTQVSTLGRRLIARGAVGDFHLIAAEGKDFEGLPVGLIEFLHGAMDGNRLAFNVLRPADGAVWIADFGPGAPATLEIPTLGAPALGLLALGLAVAASRALHRRNSTRSLSTVEEAVIAERQ